VLRDEFKSVSLLTLVLLSLKMSALSIFKTNLSYYRLVGSGPLLCMACYSSLCGCCRMIFTHVFQYTLQPGPFSHYISTSQSYWNHWKYLHNMFLLLFYLLGECHCSAWQDTCSCCGFCTMSFIKDIIVKRHLFLICFWACNLFLKILALLHFILSHQTYIFMCHYIYRCSYIW
jgi:hypothetical protein